MRGIVPDAILDRRDKIGFATPESRWLATLRPWVEDVLADDTTAQLPGLNRSVMKEQAVAMIEGRQAFDFRVWRWLNVIRWAQKFEVTF
jgi:asparagine synthase (glutamine-hydrolysing)